MLLATKGLQHLTADDIMTREMILLPEGMSLREAARLLLHNQVGGAPVVDDQGRCVGVLSAFDFLRVSGKGADARRPSSPPQQAACSFQARRALPGGPEVTLCTLPPGVCPIQVVQHGPAGEDLTLCSQPQCVLTDWQVVELDQLPAEEVRQFMTPSPVTARPATPVRQLARAMIDAHVHRVVVVDDQQRPVGLVSSTDLLSLLARGEAPG